MQHGQTGRHCRRLELRRRSMGQVTSEIADDGWDKLPQGTAAGDSGSRGVLSEEHGRNLFKKYELGKLLGHGAFAKVYHACDLDTGQNVAIKSINKRRILKGNLASHIEREIFIMCTLRHPHIVRLHEVLATKTKIYSVMEFAKGGELFSKIAKGGRFSEDLSRKYFQQLISAVGYCHAHGVFHRDLKPENLLLDENWDLKVTDFGLSALTDQIRPDGLLHTLCGTPAYVAPEMLARKGYEGAKVDVWSCGVILFVLNAGYLPFNHTNLITMYRRICKGEFRCPRWTSPELKRLLTRLLDPNPRTRITVDEVLKDPWFKKGYQKIRLPVDREFEFKNEGTRYLNAFDLISYSSGANLSGLFSRASFSCSEMFVSGGSPERIIEGIAEVAAEEGEGLRVAKKGKGVRLQGQKWNFIVMVEVNRLTEYLVVVEVKRSGFGPDFWEEKLKPRLNHLLHAG